jgi:hypothetical protein
MSPSRVVSLSRAPHSSAITSPAHPFRSPRQHSYKEEKLTQKHGHIPTVKARKDVRDLLLELVGHIETALVVGQQQPAVQAHRLFVPAAICARASTRAHGQRPARRDRAMRYVDTSGAFNLPIISLRGRFADSTLDWATAGSETSCGGAGASSCIRRRVPRWLGPGDAGTNADAPAAPTRNNAARRTDGMVAARCASLSKPTP